MAIYDTIISEWEIEDSNINTDNLDISLLEIDKLHSKYLNEYIKAKNLCDELEIKLKKLKHLKSIYYKGAMPKEKIDSLQWEYDPFQGSKKPLKSEIPSWIDSDKHVIELTKQLNEAQTYKEAMIQIRDQIKWRSSNIKNIIDYRKFMMGE